MHCFDFDAKKKNMKKKHNYLHCYKLAYSIDKIVWEVSCITIY